MAMSKTLRAVREATSRLIYLQMGLTKAIEAAEQEDVGWWDCDVLKLTRQDLLSVRDEFDAMIARLEGRVGDVKQEEESA